MSSYQHFKPLPTSDETTEFGTVIHWSQIVYKTNPHHLRQTLRFVPITCRCGEVTELDVNVLRRMKYRGCCLKCAAHFYAVRGSKHSDWKGGSYITPEGYRHINIGALTADELSKYGSMVQTRRPYIPEHRLVVARSLGRPLERDEHVHHINGNKLDNRIENLQLVTPSGHAAVELVKAREEIKRLRALVAVLLLTQRT